MKTGDRIKAKRRNGGGYKYGVIVGVSTDMFHKREKVFIVSFDESATEIAVHAKTIEPVKRRIKKPKIATTNVGGN